MRQLLKKLKLNVLEFLPLIPPFCSVKFNQAAAPLSTPNQDPKKLIYRRRGNGNISSLEICYTFQQCKGWLQKLTWESRVETGL